MITLDETVDFIHQHYPVSMTWEQGVLEKWITWASIKMFLFQAIGESGLAGLAIARPVTHLVGIKDNHGWHDENGHYIFLDLVIAHDKRVKQALALAILSRFGEREKVAFRRKGKLKIHSIAKAKKALLTHALY